MASAYLFRWANWIAWRSLCSAAAGAAAFALAAGGPFAWWRLLLAAGMGIAVVAVELGGERRNIRSLVVLAGIGGAFVAILHIPVLAALLPISLFLASLIFGVLLFLCFGIVHVFFRGGGAVAAGIALLLSFFAAFVFFSLFVPLSALSLSFSLLLTLGIFLAVAFPVGEVFASAGGWVPRRAARLAGYAVGFLGAEAAFLLTFSSFSPFRLALLLTLAVILSLRMVGTAARGILSPRVALWELAAFFALAAFVFLL